ncbi:MAG: helix-turn-helix transcriptional regulator [Nitrospira sp.]
MQNRVGDPEAKLSLGQRRAQSSQAMAPVDFVMPGVTAREAQVVEWLTKGLTNKEIASQLQISSRTVQTHMERMFKKLGVRSRAELVARAYMSRSLTGN